MHKALVESVQFINCTDEPTGKIDNLLTKKANLPPHPGSRYRPPHPPWLSHRTLHPLWKTRMQVRTGLWSWPQVLPVRQLSRSETPARLRSSAIPETRCTVSRQLPKTENPHRNHLRHQSGTPAKEGRVLNHPRLKSGGLRLSAKADWGRHHGSTLKSASWSRSVSC